MTFRYLCSGRNHDNAAGLTTRGGQGRAAIDGGADKAWTKSANGYPETFACLTLEHDAGDARHRFTDVVVRKQADVLCRDRIDYLVGFAFDIRRDIQAATNACDHYLFDELRISCFLV